jgi:hypothetical protein
MIFIWVRRTTDWADEQAFRAQVDPRFLPKVEVWNETFDIPFHLFRQRVREIARLNHSRIDTAVCASWDEIPDGALVAPVDDDDWFAPDLADALDGASDSGTIGYRWISSFVQVPINFAHRLNLIRRRVLRPPPKHTCTTNNYAMVKGPGAQPLLGSHLAASEWFDRSEVPTVMTVERRLSVMNRTLASQTQMGFEKPSVSRSELLQKLRRYRSLYARQVPPELAWCRPYLGMMSELIEQLDVR